jgi:hypothetical protein
LHSGESRLSRELVIARCVIDAMRIPGDTAKSAGLDIRYLDEVFPEGGRSLNCSYWELIATDRITESSSDIPILAIKTQAAVGAISTTPALS